MRRALFGGSFDPPHNGHLAIIRAVLEQDLADEVLVVPAGRNPHKAGTVASATHRLRMAELAFAELPGTRVLDFEARKVGPSYTIETLAELRRRYPGDAFLLLLGADSLLEFDRWRAPEQIASLAELIVFPRPGVETRVPELFAGRASVLACFAMDVSSTAVRAAFAAGRRPVETTPAAVLAYIEAHGLYGAANRDSNGGEKGSDPQPCL